MVYHGSMADDSPDYRPQVVDTSIPHMAAKPFVEGGDIQRGKFMNAFLRDFGQSGNVALSCRNANVGRCTVYKWVRGDVDGFAARFVEAEAEANERLEEEIFRRGVAGWDEAVFYKGEQCGAIRKYSDILLIFLAKARMPAKYRDRFEGANLSFGDQFNINSLSIGQRNNIINLIASLPEEELMRLAERGQGA